MNDYCLVWSQTSVIPALEKEAEAEEPQVQFETGLDYIVKLCLKTQENEAKEWTTLWTTGHVVDEHKWTFSLLCIMIKKAVAALDHFLLTILTSLVKSCMIMSIFTAEEPSHREVTSHSCKWGLYPGIWLQCRALTSACVTMSYEKGG
jgi:hypothetical protein